MIPFRVIAPKENQTEFPVISRVKDRSGIYDITTSRGQWKGYVYRFIKKSPVAKNITTRPDDMLIFSPHLVYLARECDPVCSYRIG
jgi:hypothetical protein